MPIYPNLQNRTVRVFISSTFQDMHAERDYLIRHVFPELRALCRERQVELVEVDLRWGITRKQAEKGEILPRCLDTIHECRPFFIGIIGNRYGWIPQRHEIPEYLFKEQPWLVEHLDRSITELEILHGVLNNPDMNDRTFFYFRETATAKGKVPRETEGTEQRKKLRKLKNRIKSSRYPVFKYKNLKTLGAAVINNLWKAIDNQYPPFSVPDDVSRWALEQSTFAASRLKLYTPRIEWRDILDDHTTATSTPLVLTGASGIGKSALLADWAYHFQQQHPHDCLLLHFIGISRESARPEVILRRFITELQHFFNLDERIPDANYELAATFRIFLQKASARGRTVLVIDALNQIEGDKDIPLSWLPLTFPENVRAVFSTTAGPVLADFRKRGWHVLTLEPPGVETLRQMITDYLRYYSKTIEEVHIDRITATPQAGNPLFLRVLLDEMRITARYGRVEKTLSGYLKAPTPADLFDRLLSRWESDFNNRKNSLIRDALSLLAVSRRGLSENELLEILGDRDNNNPLAQAHWTPFYQAASTYLINRSGFFWFFHDHLRQAVERRYLSKPKERCEKLFRLTNYYCEQISRDKELGGTYRDLAIAVAEDAVSCAEKTRNRRLQAQAYLNCSGALLSAAVGISDSNVVHFNRMVELVNKGCEIAKQAGARDIEADALCRRAVDETLTNPDFGKFEFLDEAIALRRTRKDHEGVRDALRDKARIGMRLNRLDITEACLLEADAIQRRLRKPDIQWTNIHQHQYWGECLALQGRWAEALDRLTQALNGAEHYGHHGAVTAAIGWIGLVRCHLGESELGIPLVCTAMERERGLLRSQEGVAKWLVELARLFDDEGDVKRALHALWLAEDIYQELQHSALRWARQLLDAISARNRSFYLAQRETFNPFTAEFAPYCSLWGLPPLQWVDAPPVAAQGQLSATPAFPNINGVYWRFQAVENAIHAACSEDGTDWSIVPRPLLGPRLRHFDDLAVAPGPPPVMTTEGLLLVYGAVGTMEDSRRCQAIGQALLDPASPTRVLRRSFRPLLVLTGDDDSGEELRPPELGELIKQPQGWTISINGRPYMARVTGVR